MNSAWWTRRRLVPPGNTSNCFSFSTGPRRLKPLAWVSGWLSSSCCRAKRRAVERGLRRGAGNHVCGSPAVFRYRRLPRMSGAPRAAGLTGITHRLLQKAGCHGKPVTKSARTLCGGRPSVLPPDGFRSSTSGPGHAGGRTGHRRPRRDDTSSDGGSEAAGPPGLRHPGPLPLGCRMAGDSAAGVFFPGTLPGFLDSIWNI
jgi:hypothetical protein